MIWHIYTTNCDCASDVIARKRRPKWVFGPRCPCCNKILGFMQWRYAGKWEGDTEFEAKKTYRAAPIEEKLRVEKESTKNDLNI